MAAWVTALPPELFPRPEYDFSGAVRGKYYQRYQQGTNVVLLFKDAESVNRALRLLLDLAKQEVPQNR